MAAQQLVIRAGVGFLYPAYKSLHAIMSEDREASLAWMRYWVVLAAFSLLETLLDPLLDFLPGYLLSKCIFLVWCMAPSSKSGSNLVFTQVCAERHRDLSISTYPWYFRSYFLCSRSTMKI